MNFIGVVKTDTRKYLMAYLASQELEKKVDMYGLFNRKTIPYGFDLLAYGWIKMKYILSHQDLPWMLGITWKGSATVSF